MIDAEHLTVQFGERRALDDVSLHVEPGELVGIVGVAASGKTTLLKTLCLLVRPDQGRVRIGAGASASSMAMLRRPSDQTDPSDPTDRSDGIAGDAPDGSAAPLLDLTTLSARDLAAVRARFGFSFQNLALFDQLTAEENVSFALVRRGMADADARLRARAQLKAVGLESAAEKLPHELSGGMRRRLALARAMVARPEVGLYDDPFVGLDPVACARIARFIAREHREVGGVTLVAAGDPAPLFAVATRLVLLEEGSIAADLPPDEFARAADPAVARYLGRSRAA